MAKERLNRPKQQKKTTKECLKEGTEDLHILSDSFLNCLCRISCGSLKITGASYLLGN